MDIKPEDIMSELPRSRPHKRPMTRQDSISQAFGAMGSIDAAPLDALLDQAADPPLQKLELPEGDRKRLVLRQRYIDPKCTMVWREEYTPAHCDKCGFNVLQKRLQVELDAAERKVPLRMQGPLLVERWKELNEGQQNIVLRAVEEHKKLQHGQQADRIIYADELVQ